MTAFDVALAVPFAAALVLIVRDMRRALREHCRRPGDRIWRVMLDLPPETDR